MNIYWIVLQSDHSEKKLLITSKKKYGDSCEANFVAFV